VSVSSGWWSIAAYIVGTPSNRVTPSRCTISSALPGSKRASIVRHPPAAIVAFSAQVCPNAWNSGSAPRVMARSSMPNSASEASMLDRRLAWVSSAPFGVPVVPDV
jgi:hypothetical protein